MDSNSPLDPSNHKPNSSDETVEAGKPPVSFPIVGIGASAGGLEAIRELLQNIPTDTGMAFVLVQHLDPKHESALTELLSRAAKLEVSEVLQDTTVQPNHVYVIPPNAAMELLAGVLHLTPRTVTRGKHMPIDQFLHSLATERKSQAIAVILSGSASDGALGVTAIKAEGGVAFAQDKTAQYDGMPSSAIATGHVDFVLAPKEIAQELTRIARHPHLAERRHVQTLEVGSAGEIQNELLPLLVLLRHTTGIDFTLYNHATLSRRIRRRMDLHNLKNINNYFEYLREHPPEVESLYQDILINVTPFFRDPEAYDTLKSAVFSRLMEKRAPDETIRIWVPGCSTGEEVYSIAICLLEFLGDEATDSTKIFATDIGDKAIHTARQGVYPEKISANVSSKRLRRFFVKSADGFQVSKAIRDMCVFATQDVTKDPPFSNLDLISCRNLLIHFGPVLQERIVPIFHYSLKPSGFLMLGTSAAVGQFSDLFTLKEKRHKIYSKKMAATHQEFNFPQRNRPLGAVFDRERDRERPVGKSLAITREADRFVVDRYSPAGVVVNQNLNIVQVRGDTGPYLKLPPGELSVDVPKMAREGLVLELRQALNEAKKSGCPVRKEGLRVKTSEHYAGVTIEVVPLRAQDGAEQCFLILFEEVRARSLRARKPDKGTLATWFKSLLGTGARGELPDDRKEARPSEQVRLLRAELDETKSYLQSLIQEHEAANEELRTANEEALSANEELLSTNEELETAKEELQATNDELGTVNEELQNRNVEMAQVNGDLTNLLGSVHMPIIMLANDLRIRRFTPTAAKLFESDTKRCRTPNRRPQSEN